MSDLYYVANLLLRLRYFENKISRLLKISPHNIKTLFTKPPTPYQTDICKLIIPKPFALLKNFEWINHVKYS